MKTAIEILAMTKPEQLFSGPGEARKECLELYKRWHPDKNPQDTATANAVTAHIGKLYQLAEEKADAGTWDDGTRYQIRFKTGVTKSITYQSKHAFELGTMLVGDDHVTYLVDSKHLDLYNNFLAVTREFQYPDQRMSDNISRNLPSKVSILANILADGRLGVRVPKTPDLLLLRDVLNHFGGSIEPRHVAWIQSNLHNMTCYFRWAGLTHNDISPDTLFVSPQHHSVALLGGWWYAQQAGKPLKKVNLRTLHLLPSKVKATKKASRSTDLELLRATGRELLGDIRGVNLRTDTPAPLKAWLNDVSSGDALADYKAWKPGILEKSFGPSKFHELKLTAADLYGGR